MLAIPFARRLALVFLGCVAASLVCYADDEQEALSWEQVREKFGAVIKAEAEYEVKKKFLENYASEGADLRAFFAEGELRLLGVEYAGELGRGSLDYLVSEGQIQWVREERHRYNASPFAGKDDDINPESLYDPEKTQVSVNYFGFSDQQELLFWSHHSAEGKIETRALDSKAAQEKTQQLKQHYQELLAQTKEEFFEDAQREKNKNLANRRSQKPGIPHPTNPDLILNPYNPKQVIRVRNLASGRPDLESGSKFVVPGGNPKEIVIVP